MAKVGQSDLINRFKKASIDALQFQSPVQELKELLTQDTLQPVFNTPSDTDPNEIFIAVSPKMKKNLSHPVKSGDHAQKVQEQQGHEQRQRVYKPGPFAIFYKLNQGSQNKDAQVWYYKERKDIIGPVSSYNMDKMVFYRSIQEDTKVAFKTVDKFVKFRKIKSIVEQEQEKQES